MVVAAPFWLRAWCALGAIGGALYLAVLPIGHMTAVRSMAFVLGSVAAIALFVPPGRRANFVLLAFAAWLLAAVISLVETRDMGASIQAIENEIVRSLLVFAVFYILTCRFGVDRLWVLASALGLAFISALAIAGHVQHGEWRFHYVPRLGEFTTSIITALPLLVGFGIFGRPQKVIMLAVLAAMGLMFVAGYLTGSRVLWITVMCGIGMAVALHGWTAGQVGKRGAVIVGVACVASLVLATSVAVQRDRSLVFFEDRLVIYSAVWRKIPENPLTGTGYGQETDKSWYEKALPGTSIYHPHNIVLGYFDQMGVFGLLALLLIFVLPASALAGGLQATTPEARTAAICGLIMLACVFLRNNFDYFFVKQNLWLFFAHLGVYIGAIDHGERQAFVEPNGRHQACAT